MLNRRAVLAAAIPAVIIFGVCRLWLGFPLLVAVGVGLAWGFGSLLVTRAVYDETEADTAAWREATPDLRDDWGPK